MSPRNYLEIDFEEHIEEQLQQSGYQSSSPNEYDRKLCLIPSKLIDFIKETQPFYLFKTPKCVMRNLVLSATHFSERV